MRIGKNSPERNNARGKILYATEGLFLLDGGLRGIVQRVLNYLRERTAAMHINVMHALSALAVSCSVLPRRPD